MNPIIILFFVIPIGMPILLSFLNKNVHAYISYLRNGKGELPTSKIGITRGSLRKGLIKSYSFAYLKHFFLHENISKLPILVIYLIYTIFYEEVEINTEIGFMEDREHFYTEDRFFIAIIVSLCLIWIPLIILLKRSTRLMRFYYYIIASCYSLSYILFFLICLIDD